MHFDVFNGDADGIIALVQLRLAEPRESVLVTGVKRDINLLARVDVKQAKSATVLDVSMEKNRESLDELLASGVDVFYADHHRAGDIPSVQNLTAHIDTDPNTCTSLIINSVLRGRYAKWAVAAAFGDNMNQSANLLADEIGLNPDEKSLLKALGVYVNYNGYGRSVSDLHVKPDELFQELVKYEDPLVLVAKKGSVFEQLKHAYNDDMSQAIAADVLYDSNTCKVLVLPNEPWARRVSGVYSNELANESPDKAHAVFTLNSDKTYNVSLRAPLNNKQGAGDICATFDTGGGRAAAAGINQLHESDIDKFINAVSNYYS